MTTIKSPNIYETRAELDRRIEMLETIIDRVEELKKEYVDIKWVAEHFNIFYPYLRRLLKGESTSNTKRLEETYNLIK